MPLVQAFVPQDTPTTEKQAISIAVDEALTTVFNVPAGDKFQVITPLAPGDLICSPEYLGIAHGSKVLFLQITCNAGRSVELKQALYARLAETISERTGFAKADIIISLVEVAKENWSFGNGIAQYAQ